MEIKWYSLTWDGIVNPLVLFAALAIMGFMWDSRVLSTRSMLVLAYASVFGWVIHFDYLMFIAGTPTLRPLTGWAPWPVRLVAYAVACAFLLWGVRGWVFAKAGPEKSAAVRGLPYLKERWVRRKNHDAYLK